MYTDLPDINKYVRLYTVYTMIWEWKFWKLAYFCRWPYNFYSSPIQVVLELYRALLNLCPICWA